MQALQATIQIPPELVLITKVEYDTLKSVAEDKPQWWTMKDLMIKTNRGRKWIKQYMIDDPVIRKKIEPFTQFPKGDSGSYIFHAKKMEQFIDENFELIKERAK